MRCVRDIVVWANDYAHEWWVAQRRERRARGGGRAEAEGGGRRGAERAQSVRQQTLVDDARLRLQRMLDRRVRVVLVCQRLYLCRCQVVEDGRQMR